MEKQRSPTGAWASQQSCLPGPAAQSRCGDMSGRTWASLRKGRQGELCVSVAALLVSSRAGSEAPQQPSCLQLPESGSSWAGLPRPQPASLPPDWSEIALPASVGLYVKRASLPIMIGPYGHVTSCRFANVDWSKQGTCPRGFLTHLDWSKWATCPAAPLPVVIGSCGARGARGPRAQRPLRVARVSARRRRAGQ